MFYANLKDKIIFYSLSQLDEETKLS